VLSGSFQGAFRVLSGSFQGPFRVLSGSFQGPFKFKILIHNSLQVIGSFSHYSRIQICPKTIRPKREVRQIDPSRTRGASDSEAGIGVDVDVLGSGSNFPGGADTGRWPLERPKGLEIAAGKIAELNFFVRKIEKLKIVARIRCRLPPTINMSLK
jgi:hypothetical protein